MKQQKCPFLIWYLFFPHDFFLILLFFIKCCLCYYWVSIFNILCDEMGDMQEVQLHTDTERLSPGKALVRMSYSSHFFREYHMLLKEPDRWTMVIEVFSWKWMKWPCHLMENNWQNVLPMTKSKLLSNNCNSGKLSCYLDSFSIHTDFFEGIGGDSNEWDFLDIL